MSFTIVITKHSDYGAIFNNMHLENLCIKSELIESIESDYSQHINDILKSVIVKELYVENNDYLLRALKQLMHHGVAQEVDMHVLHPINQPSFIYKGAICYSRSCPETKKSVAKEWLIVKASEFITHSRTYKDVWLGIKSITLRENAKKVFVKVDSDAENVIGWVATPLAMRDPIKDKMLFEIHTELLATGSDELVHALKKLMLEENPLYEQSRSDIANNAVELKTLTSRIKSSMNLKPESSLATKKASDINNFNEISSLNPYTLANPAEVLDSRKIKESLNFQLSDFNHPVIKNNPDKFNIEGWLIGYFDTKYIIDMSGLKAKQWVEYFLFESLDFFYITIIKRSNNKRRSGVVKSFKIKSLDELVERKIISESQYAQLLEHII